MSKEENKHRVPENKDGHGDSRLGKLSQLWACSRRGVEGEEGQRLRTQRMTGLGRGRGRRRSWGCRSENTDEQLGTCKSVDSTDM